MTKLDIAKRRVQDSIDDVRQQIEQDENIIREYASRASGRDLAAMLPVYCKRLEEDLQRLRVYNEQLRILDFAASDQ